MKKNIIIIFLGIFLLAAFSACTNQPGIKYISEESIPTPLPLIIPVTSEDENTLSENEENGNIVSTRPAINVMITEISSAGQDWIEFYNPGQDTINLSEYSIGTCDDFSKSSNLPEIVLASKDYCCVYGKNETESVKGNFSINKNGDTIYLFYCDGSTVNSISVPAMNGNLSLVYVDGNWAYTYSKTPGQQNSSYAFLSLTPDQYSDQCPLNISEVLISNKHSVMDSFHEYNDFVEIHNPTGKQISLKGWFLSDSIENPAKWPFPDIYIEAGQYLTVYLSGHESTASELHASFSINSNERVILLNGNENKFLSFEFPSIIVNDVSVGMNNAYFRFPTPGYENAALISDISALGYFFSDDVYISEVCAFDDDFDWIELYNGSADPIDLTGWHLTNDLSNTALYIFPQIIINSDEYYLVKATSHSSEQRKDNAHFGISLSGETIYLIDNNGRLRDVFKSGMLENAASSGRIEGRTDIDRVFFTVATPGKKNSGSYLTGRTADPVFSSTSLYCTDSFSLQLHAEKGAEIYYTTDGSTPKASSKSLYSKPISITKNAVIRAIAVKDGLLDSNVITYTYLFEEPHSIPVACISLSPADKESVWSAKSKQSNSKIEKEGYFSFYEPDGKMGVSFPAGFKAKGAGTLGRSQASLSIHLRGIYGQSKVTYPFFDEYGWCKYASLVIRNSGQDYLKARIRDSLASRICFGLNIDVSATRPIAVYINGKYYGLYDLNEDQNADYLNTHFGVDQKNVEIIRFNTVQVKGSNSGWKKIIDYAKSKNFKSNDVYDEFVKQVDPDYFIDYLACSIYLCNSDMANQKYWHTTDDLIKWRPIFYDFDYAMGFNRTAKSSILERFFDPDGTATATSRIYTHIACAFVQNPEWRQRFIERYIELAYTTFDPNRVNLIIDQLVSEMESEMPRHIAKWGGRNAPESMRKWRESIDDIKSWFSLRQKYAIDSLKKYFKLSDDYISSVRKKYS